MTSATTPHVAFVLEQTLGHVTHSRNLRALIPQNDSIRATFCPIEFEPGRVLGNLPIWRNWTVRSGVRARRAIRLTGRDEPLAALFIHSQVPAVLLGDRLRRLPSVVSLDATPVQYDELGEHYSHRTGHHSVERVKWRMNRACYDAASHLVTWSDWAKASLVDHYGVADERVSVVPPGVDLEVWQQCADRRAPPGPVRILFVGGDLDRKGGADLLEAFASLRCTHTAELHLVTSAEVPSSPGVVVHNGLTANSPELVELYHSSHIFCLPTLGDCLPMVLSEAGASSLPLVSTAVGAIPEIVVEGVTGMLVPPRDSRSLATVLERLIADPDLRRRLGGAAREHVRKRFDARRNSDALVELLVRLVAGNVASDG